MNESSLNLSEGRGFRAALGAFNPTECASQNFPLISFVLQRNLILIGKAYGNTDATGNLSPRCAFLHLVPEHTVYCYLNLRIKTGNVIQLSKKFTNACSTCCSLTPKSPSAEPAYSGLRFAAMSGTHQRLDSWEK